VFYTQNLSAYCKRIMLDTAIRALTDPASLSKDISVSNEHLQEVAREAQVNLEVNSLFDGSSDSGLAPAPPRWVLVLGLRLLLLLLCVLFT
jgi:hypothetical protein